MRPFGHSCANSVSIGRNFPHESLSNHSNELRVILAKIAPVTSMMGNKGRTTLRGTIMGRTKALNLLLSAGAAIALLFPTVALADEDGVSFWLPGLFGSLAAVPQAAPGWSFLTFSYDTDVSASGDVARARSIRIGRFDPTLHSRLSADLDANV